MTINPILFSIGSLNVRWYGVLVTAGILAGVLTAMRGAPRYGWKSDDIIDVALIAIPLAIIGARLYFVIFHWERYASQPLDIIKTWEGGLAIWGGILGGIGGGALYCLWKKRSLITLMDIALPGIAIGQAIGRWGNFVNQEAYGPTVTNPAFQWFPFSVYIDATGSYHYATFFYESAWCFLLFLFLITQRKRFRHRGDVALLYLMLYSLERSFVEGLRTDSLMLGAFRVSQVLSIAVFVCIALFMLFRHLREARRGIVITNPLHADYVAPPPSHKGNAASSPSATEVKNPEAETDAKTQDEDRLKQDHLDKEA